VHGGWVINITVVASSTSYFLVTSFTQIYTHIRSCDIYYC